MGAQREILIALTGGEASHRPTRHETIKLTPNGIELTVFVKTVCAHASGSTQICCHETAGVVEFVEGLARMRDDVVFPPVMTTPPLA
jgi:hypothetical protein